MSLRGSRLAFAPVPASPTGAGKKAGVRGNL